MSVDALARGSASRDGVAAEITAGRKGRRYNGCSIWLFPIEDHGRWGDDALALARVLAPIDQDTRSQALVQLHQAMAATLQRVAADAVLAACARRA